MPITSLHISWLSQLSRLYFRAHNATISRCNNVFYCSFAFPFPFPFLFFLVGDCTNNAADAALACLCLVLPPPPPPPILTSNCLFAATTSSTSTFLTCFLNGLATLFNLPVIVTVAGGIVVDILVLCLLLLFWEGEVLPVWGILLVSGPWLSLACSGAIESLFATVYATTAACPLLGIFRLHRGISNH